MSRTLIEDARRTSHYLEALGASRTSGENTAMQLLRSMSDRMEKLCIAIEPLVAEADIWTDAPSDAGILVLGRLPDDGRERASIGDIRMLRQEWFGGPEAEARADAESILQSSVEPTEGVLDDLVDEWHARSARRVIASGNLGQMQAVVASRSAGPEQLEAEVVRTFTARAERMKACDVIDQAAWLLHAGCPRTVLSRAIREARSPAGPAGMDP